MKYVLYDGEKIAEVPGHGVFGNASYDTYEEAVEYAAVWLGDVWSPGTGVLKVALRNNKSYDYSGYGDKIRIIEN